MKTPIFLIYGEAGAGKDTFAGLLGTTEAVKSDRPRTLQRIALADPLKRAGYDIFGFGSEQLWGSSDKRNEVVSMDFDKDRVYHKIGCWAEAEGVRADARVLSRKASDWIAMVHYEWRKNKTLTPRYVLQTLGTEFGRSIDPNIWVNIAIKTADELLSTCSTYHRETGVQRGGEGSAWNNGVIITDGRFRNEILGIMRVNGYTLHVYDNRPTPFDGHASEQEQRTVPQHWFDGTFLNVKGTTPEDKAYRMNLLADAASDWYRDNVVGV